MKPTELNELNSDLQGEREKKSSWPLLTLKKGKKAPHQETVSYPETGRAIKLYSTGLKTPKIIIKKNKKIKVSYLSLIK